MCSKDILEKYFLAIPWTFAPKRNLWCVFKYMPKPGLGLGYIEFGVAKTLQNEMNENLLTFEFGFQAEEGFFEERQEQMVLQESLSEVVLV